MILDSRVLVNFSLIIRSLINQQFSTLTAKVKSLKKINNSKQFYLINYTTFQIPDLTF